MEEEEQEYQAEAETADNQPGNEDDNKEDSEDDNEGDDSEPVEELEGPHEDDPGEESCMLLYRSHLGRFAAALSLTVTTTFNFKPTVFRLICLLR